MNQWKNLRWRLRSPIKIVRDRKVRGANLATRLAQLLYKTGGNPNIRLFIESFVKAEGKELEVLGLRR